MTPDAEISALRRIVRWACDAEDVGFFVRDNGQDREAIALVREIVLGLPPIPSDLSVGVPFIEEEGAEF